MIFIIEVLNFLFLKKIIGKLNRKTTFPLMYFVVKIVWFILFIYQIKNLKTMDLLMKIDEDNTKNKNKKHFCKHCLQCSSSKKVLIIHKETCLKIYGEQGVKLRSGSIKFKNHFTQLAVPFKIFGDFESFLKRVKISDK